MIKPTKLVCRVQSVRNGSAGPVREEFFEYVLGEGRQPTDLAGLGAWVREMGEKYPGGHLEDGRFGSTVFYFK